jgi:hypothetical protein
MTNPESETLKAGIGTSGGTGIVIFAIFVAAQIIVGALGLVLDSLRLITVLIGRRPRQAL